MKFLAVWENDNMVPQIRIWSTKDCCLIRKSNKHKFCSFEYFWHFFLNPIHIWFSALFKYSQRHSTDSHHDWAQSVRSTCRIWRASVFDNLTELSAQCSHGAVHSLPHHWSSNAAQCIFKSVSGILGWVICPSALAGCKRWAYRHRRSRLWPPQNHRSAWPSCASC